MTRRAPTTQAAGRDVAEPLLHVERLVTHFSSARGRVRAVDGVTMQLDRGKALGLVGESGSGKTILSRSIMGLLPTHGVHRSGMVRFAGQEISAMSPRRMRSIWGAEMAMIFQDPMTSLNPLMRIGEQVAEPLRLHLGMSTRQALDTAERLLHDVRIPEAQRRMTQYPHELSGGTRQRVMIAIAIACGPTLLLADEPTTALDVTVQSQILELIGEQQRDRNMSVILVTHDLGVVAGHTDEVAVMYGGQIVERAPTRTLFANVRMPYTEALLRSIPSTTAPSHTRLPVIGGRPPDLVNPPAGCRFAPRCPYAEQRCREQAPPLTTDGDETHLFACWYPVGTPSRSLAGEPR